MKVKRKAGPPLGPWDIAACVMAGLLYLDVLLLLGLFLYFLGKSRGMGKLSRRLLLGGLIAGGVMLLLFALAVGALILYTATYTAGL